MSDWIPCPNCKEMVPTRYAPKNCYKCGHPVSFVPVINKKPFYSTHAFLIVVTGSVALFALMIAIGFYLPVFLNGRVAGTIYLAIVLIGGKAVYDFLTRPQ